MKKLRFKAMAATLVALAVVMCMGVSAKADSSPAEAVASVEEYLSATADLMEQDNQPSSRLKEIQTVAKGGDSGGFEEEVVAYREQMRSLGEVYRSVSTNVDVVEVLSRTEKSVELIVNEVTMMEVVGAGTETGYSALHHISLEKGSEGQWLVAEDRHLEPTGLLPLYQAEKYVVTARGPERFIPRPINDLSSVGEEEEVVRAKQVEMEELSPASIERPGNLLLSDPKVDEGLARTSGARPYAPIPGLDYWAMANYLERYWSKYNPDYRSWPNDCTNFVSQALKEGGWPNSGGWYRWNGAWWYSPKKATWSWVNVESWKDYATNHGKRVTTLGNVWEMGRGDVLLVKKPGASRLQHAMMVSYHKDGTPYFTYHTSNRYRRSMNQVLVDWKGGTFYAFRT